MFSRVTKKYFSSSIVIVNGKRTPMGSFMGKLSTIHPCILASAAIQGALQASKVAKEEVDEAILGNVLSAGLGQAPTRQAALKAGLLPSTVCTTINKVCSSGMKAVHFGAQSIMTGNSEVVVAGGFESMSLTPHYLYVRKAFPWGDPTLVDGIRHDGLTDSFNKMIMGSCMEKVNKDLQIGRKEQDDWAIQSYERAIAANKNGLMKKEIVEFDVEVAKDKIETISEDEECFKFRKEKIPTLKPAFEKDGTITAANASKNSDGACAFILMSEELAKKKGLSPIARIRGFADAEIDPMNFSIAPASAIPKLLKKCKVNINEIDAFEIGEAFAGTVLANIKLLNLPIEKVNLHGGAISLGHPIGMSGARIILSLVNVLQNMNGRLGVAAICNGGGGASSILIERLDKH
jgi:acetyl-CoA C-acetyltransferase